MDQPQHVLVQACILAGLDDIGTTPQELPYLLRDDGDLAVVLGPMATSPHRVVVVSSAGGVAPDTAPGADLVLFVDRADATIRAAQALAGRGASRRQVPVTVVPADADVFDRVRGVFESATLQDKCVLIVGCGSGGSFVLRELVRAGVGKFVLIDHDRLELANVCRHELGLRDIGRLKVNALRDYVLERNPRATVTVDAFKLNGRTFDRLMALVESSNPDLIICGTDNRESRLLVNRASLLTRCRHALRRCAPQGLRRPGATRHPGLDALLSVLHPWRTGIRTRPRDQLTG